MNRSRCLAFSLIELLVTLVIVAVLVGLLASYAPITFERVRAAQCASNLRQIGLSLSMYLSDNDQRMPTITDQDIDQVFLPYAENNKAIFVCPSDRDSLKNKGCSYSWNRFLNNQLFSHLYMQYGNSSPITKKRDIQVSADRAEPHHHQPELKKYNERGRRIILWADGSVDNHAIIIPRKTQ